MTYTYTYDDFIKLDKRWNKEILITKIHWINFIFIEKLEKKYGTIRRQIILKAVVTSFGGINTAGFI